jgi:3-carboxy-cis,cis-muconate cycloisomerase
MTLYSQLFGDLAVVEHFSETAILQAMLDVEVALAEACATAGLVPSRCLPAIKAAADARDYDLAAIRSETAQAGNAAIPLVRALTAKVAARDADAPRYVHIGATSQDVIDTALVLALRAALPHILAEITHAESAAARHAGAHRDTPIAGRTWLQHATPTTFGVKAAGWLDALGRGRSSIEQRASEMFVLQFGGASGTLSTLGPAARAISEDLGNRLGLTVPDVPWHAHRDRQARLACALAVLTGTLGKIATDLVLLGQTEVGEAVEPRASGGSSAMPHKHNPVSAAVALAAAIRVPGLVASLLGGMLNPHERGIGGWQAEWEVMPELVVLTAGAARSIAAALDHLVVDSARMAANLALTGGLSQSESVVAALTPHLGRPEAYRVVQAACDRAIAERRPLGQVLENDPVVSRALSRDAIARCLTPGENLGDAGGMVDRALATWRRRGTDHA